MGVLAKTLANEAQPGNPGMGGFRHRSLHVEMDDRFRAAGTLLGQPSLAGIAHARCAVAHRAVADEIDVDVFVGRPMAAEIVEKGGPIGLQAMGLEIAERKREAMVDPDQRGNVLSQPPNQPFGDATPRPALVWE